MPILEDFLDAIPTAELEPFSDKYVQSDEIDMGMTYDEVRMKESVHLSDSLAYVLPLSALS